MFCPCFVVQFKCPLVLQSSRDRWRCFTLYSWCHVAVSVLCLFLTVPWVGMQCVLVAFPGHTYFLVLYLHENV